MALVSGGQRGHAVLEVAFLLPLLAFCFLGAFNAGSCAFALVCVERAARVAGMYASTSEATAQNPTLACYYALEQLRAAPNVGSGVNSCGIAPVVLATQYLPLGSDGLPAVRVSVSYTTPTLLPIPGVMTGAYTFHRVVEFPIRG